MNTLKGEKKSVSKGRERESEYMEKIRGCVKVK